MHLLKNQSLISPKRFSFRGASFLPVAPICPTSQAQKAEDNELWALEKRGRAWHAPGGTLLFSGSLVSGDFSVAGQLASLVHQEP